MYFIPPTKWSGDGIYAEVDFNYKTEKGIDTICNISIVDKKDMPKGISAVIFTGDNNSYKLTGLNVLLTESRNNKIRITTIFNRDEFLQFISSEKIYLEIQMNKKTYKLTPSKAFIRLKSELKNDLEGMEKGVLY